MVLFLCHEKFCVNKWFLPHNILVSLLLCFWQEYLNNWDYYKVCSCASPLKFGQVAITLQFLVFDFTDLLSRLNIFVYMYDHSQIYPGIFPVNTKYPKTMVFQVIIGFSCLRIAKAYLHLLKNLFMNFNHSFYLARIS